MHPPSTVNLLKRIPEPELMGDPEQARAYANADFSVPHRAFAADRPKEIAMQRRHANLSRFHVAAEGDRHLVVYGRF